MICISITPSEIVTHNCDDLPFTHVSRKRASWIEPVNLPLRMAFKALRCVPDASWVAGWTRTWPCQWRVNLGLSDGPIVGPFNNRAEALEFEHTWLAKSNLQTVTSLS